MNIKTILAAASFAVAGSVASAATVSLNTAVTPEAIGAISGQDFQTELGNAGNTHLFSGPMTLITSGPATVTFSLVAAESGFQNTLLVDGSAAITENGNGGVGTDFATNVLQGQTFTLNFAGGDLAEALTFEAFDFSQGTTDTFTSGDDEFGVFANSADIGALKVFYLALDDDGANRDDNHDDIIVRVEISAVPLPASGLLLLAGLGGVFGARRFRRKA